jgi:hypothetical protein
VADAEISAQGSEGSSASPHCPLCGSGMARRTTRRGANSGREFWSCDRFPIDGCSGTIDIDLCGDAVSASGGPRRPEFKRQHTEHHDPDQSHRPWLFVGCTVAVAAGAAGVLTHSAMLGALAFFVVAISVVWVVPASAQNWANGASGEALTARALELLKVNGFVILHNRFIPGMSAHIDHIVIGPPGVAVVVIESYSGQLRVRGNDVYVHGYPGTWKTVGEVKQEAWAVSLALAGELQRRRVKVRPILCVHRANLPFFLRSPRGVSIVDGRGLVKLLCAARPVLSPADVRILARLANDRLRPAATPMPDLYLQELGRNDDSKAIVQPGLAPDTFRDLRYAPPAQREHIRIARESRAAATDQRSYWTNRGVTEGKAPPTIRPDESA